MFENLFIAFFIFLIEYLFMAYLAGLNRPK
jgi:hypothetical protein